MRGFGGFNMKTLPITKDLLKGLKYSPQTGIIYRTKSVSTGKVGPVLTSGGNGYRSITINGKTYRQHRLAFAFMGVDIPDRMVVDHINGVKEDNRWENLRLVTQAENNLNQIRHRNNGTPYVLFHSNIKKWVIHKHFNKRPVYFGAFDTEKEAIDEANRLTKAGWPIPDNSPKYITFVKIINRWKVVRKIDGEYCLFGYFKTEAEAIKRRDELERGGWPKRKPKPPKYINFNKSFKMWVIRKVVDGKRTYFGQFKTESEAIKRRDELIANGWKK